MKEKLILIARGYDSVDSHFSQYENVLSQEPQIEREIIDGYRIKSVEISSNLNADFVACIFIVVHLIKD